MSNDSPEDQYFASTQMQSRWEDLEAEDVNVKKTSHKIAELQKFASTSEESERSDNSSLKNLLKKSKQNTSKVKKAQLSAKKKKASRIKSLANLMNKKYTQSEGHEQVHDKKNGYQSTLSGILGDNRDGDSSAKSTTSFSDNMFGSASDKLYSSEEWHQVQKSIELKYPNTDRKRHYVNVFDSFGPYGNPEKGKDIAIWSQANTPPQEKLSSQEFNILHRHLGAHEDMERNKHMSRDDEASVNEPSSQYILTLSQIMDSHNNSVLEEVISDSSSCPSPLNYSSKPSGAHNFTNYSQENGVSDDEAAKYPHGHISGTALAMKNTPDYESPEAFTEPDDIPGSSPSTINDSEVYGTPLANLDDPIITSSISNLQELDKGFDLTQNTSSPVDTQYLVSDSASSSNTASINFGVLQNTSRIEKCEVQVRRGLNLRSCRIGSTKIYIKKLYTKNVVNNSDEEILASDFDPEDEGEMDVIEIIKQRADEDRSTFGSADEHISANKPVLQVPSSPEIA